MLVIDYLTKMGVKTVPHPPYSPDLTPCDFWLFPKLGGCSYERIEEMKEAVTKVIDTLTQEVVGTVQQVHCSRKRLLRRGLEFHVCAINKSAHTKKKSPETYLIRFVISLFFFFFFALFVFSSNPRIITSTRSLGKFYSFLFCWHIYSVCHLSRVRPSASTWFSFFIVCLSFPFVHFTKGLKYLTKGTYSFNKISAAKVPRIFLVLLR